MDNLPYYTGQLSPLYKRAVINGGSFPGGKAAGAWSSPLTSI